MSIFVGLYFRIKPEMIKEPVQNYQCSAGSCGKKAKEDANFCSSCGAKIAQTVSYKSCENTSPYEVLPTELSHYVNDCDESDIWLIDHITDQHGENIGIDIGYETNVKSVDVDITTLQNAFDAANSNQHVQNILFYMKTMHGEGACELKFGTVFHGDM
jgi:hypothetical protein